MTLSELLEREAKHLTGFVYSTFPYSCGLAEAKIHSRHNQAPTPAQMTIQRNPDQVIITIKPLKGSRKRKPMIIKLWTA